jgi:hypothetical protein
MCWASRGLADPDGYDVEHVVPRPRTTGPATAFALGEYTEDEQNSHRALASTLGNLTLIEESLAERVFGDSFPSKREAYRRSRIPARPHSPSSTRGAPRRSRSAPRR